MLHRNRIWQLSSVSTAEELAHKLTQYTWTCCTAISFGGYLFANDATSADGAQEYAILKPSAAGALVQVESITFSWCSEPKALELIRRITSGAFDSDCYGMISPDRFQTSQEHGYCDLCL